MTMTSTTSTTPIPPTLLSSPFTSDYAPRPLPLAAKKPYADLGSSSIRSAYNMSTLTGPPMASSSSSSSPGIKVVNSNLRTLGSGGNTGFSVQRRTSSYAGPSSSSFGGALAGPSSSSRPGVSNSSRSSSYGQDGPSKRKMFYAVAVGHQKGIYETWAAAEEQIKGHPAPQWKTFKTRLAAESYIISSAPFAITAPPDADTGAYDMQLEYPSSSSSPTSPTYEAPLHERLQRDFPSTTPKSAPSPPLAELQPPRPHFARGNGSRSSSPSSPVKRSSPLRQEVTDDEAEHSDSVAALSSEGSVTRRNKKRTSFMARLSNGLLSPPTSPEAAAKGTKTFRVEAIERPVLAPPIVLPPTDVSRPNSRASSRNGHRSSSRPTSIRSPSTGDVAAAAAYEQRPESIRSVSSSSIVSGNGNRASFRPPATPSKGLWGDVTPPPSPPLSPPHAKFAHGSRAASPSGSDADSEGFSSPTTNAPKFSRSALKKQGVLLPVPANASSRPASPALSRSPSFTSLKRKTSSNSLNSIGSFGSFGALRDKLAAVQIVEEPQDGERENVPPPQSPADQNDKDRLRPGLASRSVSKESIASISSFATAQDFVMIPTTPPKKPIQDGSGNGDSQLADPERLSPIHSNASGSEDHHGSSRSDATHTQSEACPGKYGTDRKLGKKRSFKRLLKALGFSKMDETKDKADWERRLSA